MHVRDLVRGLTPEVDFEVVVGEGGFLADDLAEAGVPVRVVPSLQRAIRPAAEVRALRELRRRVVASRADLVHTHSTKAGVLGRIAGRLEGVPVLHTAHSWAFSEGIPWRQRGLAVPVEALLGRLTAGFVTVSEADRALGLRYRIAPPERLHVVHNGVADVPSRAEPGRAGVPRVVMVARMAPPKEPLALLRALAGVDSPWRLRLVGDGPERHLVEREIAASGLRDRVELAGVSEAVADELAAAQIFVLCSRQEGFPLSVLEAMRAGLPVVASDVGGVSEAVEHRRTGLLVPRGGTEALRAALQELVDDPELRAALGAAGRRAYEERFSLDRMLLGTARVYREVAGP